MNFFIISSSFLTFFILYNYNALIAGYPDYLSRLSRLLLSFFFPANPSRNSCIPHDCRDQKVHESSSILFLYQTDLVVGLQFYTVPFPPFAKSTTLIITSKAFLCAVWDWKQLLRKFLFLNIIFNGSCLVSSLSLSLSLDLSLSLSLFTSPPPVLFLLLFDSPKIVLKMNGDLSISDPYIRLP